MIKISSRDEIKFFEHFERIPFKDIKKMKEDNIEIDISRDTRLLLDDMRGLSILKERAKRLRPNPKTSKVKKKIDALIKQIKRVVNEKEAKRNPELHDKVVSEKKEHLKKYGLFLSEHAYNRWVERYPSYSNVSKDDLMRFFMGLGIKKKVKGSGHQVVKLNDNIEIVVVDHIIMTVYDPTTPKS